MKGGKMKKIEDVYKEYANIIYKYIYSLSNNKDIEEEIRSGIMLGRLDRKVRRILKAKEEYKVSTDKIEVDNEFVEEVNNKIKIIREKCK